jgi:hypothetical protein
VLRFFEWTWEGDKSEQEASIELAELLWQHKETRNPQNSINRKASLIQEWASEYRSTGKLEEPTHGAHIKTASILAREDIANAALRELARMAKPGPAALRDALLNKIFPKFAIQDSKVSENTCRNYMEKWGWKTGGYRQWVPKHKRLLDVGGESDSDEGNAASDETSILENNNAGTQPTSVNKPKYFHAPIPSPTTAIRSIPPTPAPSTMIPHSTGALTEFQNGSVVITSPTTTFTDPSMTMADQNSALFWSTTQGYTPTQQSQFYPYSMPPTFQPTPQFSQESRQHLISQTHSHYIPKSLEHIVPDPPEIMGIRPSLNETPITAFVPHPSLMGHFAHDTTFPQATRRTSNLQNGGYNPSSQLQYMPDLTQ